MQLPNLLTAAFGLFLSSSDNHTTCSPYSDLGNLRHEANGTCEKAAAVLASIIPLISDEDYRRELQSTAEGIHDTCDDLQRTFNESLSIIKDAGLCSAGGGGGSSTGKKDPAEL